MVGTIAGGAGDCGGVGDRADDRALVPGALMDKPQHSDEEITEQIVEGIWAENQYKIENIPGYADAFNRAYACVRKSIDDDYKPNKHDQEELERAMAELVLLTLYGPK